jgi:hypothetical protein
MRTSRLAPSLVVVLALIAGAAAAHAGHGAVRTRAKAAKAYFAGRHAAIQGKPVGQAIVETGATAGFLLGVSADVGAGVQTKAGSHRLVLSLRGAFRGGVFGAWGKLGLRVREGKPGESRIKRILETDGTMAGIVIGPGGEIASGTDHGALYAGYGFGVLVGGSERSGERRFAITPWWKGKALRRVERGLGLVDEALQLIEHADQLVELGLAEVDLAHYYRQANDLLDTADGVKGKLERTDARKARWDARLRRWSGEAPTPTKTSDGDDEIGDGWALGI